MDKTSSDTGPSMIKSSNKLKEVKGDQEKHGMDAISELIRSTEDATTQSKDTKSEPKLEDTQDEIEDEVGRRGRTSAEGLIDIVDAGSSCS